MLHMHYGRESLDREKFIFDRIRCDMTDRQNASADGNGQRIILLVPDQYTLEAEQQAFRHLQVRGLMNVEVLSMSRLGSRLLSELGGSRQTFIDKYGRHMILARVARENREKLQVFRGLEGSSAFIENVNNFISEMKQYNCGIGELDSMVSETEEGSYTRRKLEDLKLLYSCYEEEIRGKYTDSEDYIDLYLRKIHQSDFLRGSQIWVYGFDSFAPKALSVLGQLMGRAAEVHVVLTWDSGGRDHEIFTLTGLVMDNLQREADAAGIPSSREEIPKRYERNRAARGLVHLERELYAMPARREDDCAGITLTAAAGIYNEAESAAAYVLHLVRDCGLRYRDIRLVCNDQEIRGPVVERIFQEYGIPVFCDRKRDILSSPVIQYLLSLLNTVAESCRTEDLMQVLKSGFGDLTREEVTDLENYAIRYRIRYTMWKRPFTKGAAEYGEEELARLEQLRQKAMEPLEALEVQMRCEGGDLLTMEGFISRFYRFLYDTVNLPDKILDFIASQEELRRMDLAEETGQIWNKTVGILDQMAEIMGSEPFDLKLFRDIFQVGLSQVEIGVLPPTRDGLLMGTMQRTRMSHVRALVAVGVNEGILPQEKTEPGLFSSEEKELFRSHGTELCKVDSVMLMEERLAIYRNLSSTEEYLWLSCSLSDEEGKECRPSSVFLKIQELFPKLQVQRDVLNSGEVLPLVHGGVSSLRHLTEALQEAASEEEIDGTWKETFAWYQENRKEELGIIRSGLAFTNRQESLGQAAARQLFLKNPEGAYSLSPSRLERFSRCPFSHFVSYGLRPEERRIFQVAPREIGDIYHECLMTLTRALTRPDLDVTHPLSPWMTITRQECGELVRQTAKQQMEQYRDGLFQQGKEESYRSRRICEICEKACWAVVEQVRAGQIETSQFEVPFRRGGEIPPITVRAGNETVYIEGKIDRVDYLPGNRVKIIDYKTGNEKFSAEEAREGYRLQLMLYLQAACEQGRKPAGIFYFHISEPMADATGKEWNSEDLAREIRKNFKLNGVMIDDPEIIRSIAGDFSGYSEIVPLRAGKEKITETGKGSLLSEESFENLREEVAKKTVEICRSLTEGEIAIHPMKTKERSACTYCEYMGICRFDTVFDGCSYNMIDTKKENGKEKLK
ncbi:MAG: PD-(D/E)XK nuclease family protein [Firmicutes bacterium]|nr:PD-(D/E)XK nuclease family protein [Bacillota bacterium]